MFLIESLSKVSIKRHFRSQLPEFPESSEHFNETQYQQLPNYNPLSYSSQNVASMHINLKNGRNKSKSKHNHQIKRSYKLQIRKELAISRVNS